jgi:hypothetical protein
LFKGPARLTHLLGHRAVVEVRKNVVARVEEGAQSLSLGHFAAASLRRRRRCFNVPQLRLVGFR